MKSCIQGESGRNVTTDMHTKVKRLLWTEVLCEVFTPTTKGSTIPVLKRKGLRSRGASRDPDTWGALWERHRACPLHSETHQLHRGEHTERGVPRGRRLHRDAGLEVALSEALTPGG